MKRKVLSIVMALALCVGLLPVTARAADTDLSSDKSITTETALTSGTYGPETGHATITLSGNGRFTIESGQTVTLRNLTVTGGNISNKHGGAINNSGILTITNCTFSDNKTTGTGLAGGAILNAGTMTATGCTFTGNSSVNGGAICNRNGTSLTLESCTFSGNSSSDGGGAIYNQKPAVLTNCTFSGNTGSGGGAIFNTSGGTAILDKCLFTLNSAEGGNGSAISVQDGSNDTKLYANNCVFANNTNGHGAICAANHGYIYLTNCSFINNTGVNTTTGGIYLYNNIFAFYAANCLFIGNTGANGHQDIYNNSSHNNLASCVYSNGHTGADSTDANCNVQTAKTAAEIFVGAANGDYHIASANNSSAQTNISTFFNVSGATVNMGYGTTAWVGSLDGLSPVNTYYDGKPRTTNGFVGAYGTPVPTANTNLTYTGSAQELATDNNISGVTWSTTQDGAYTGTIPSETDAGTYTIYYKIDNGDAVKVTATIAPKPVTVSGITASDKTYDGDTTATLNYNSATITGKVGSDTLTVTATGAFENANVGTNKSVTISDLALDGDNKDNYTLAAEGQQATATASIAAATLTEVSVSQSGTLTYTGEAQTPTVSTSATAVNGQAVTFTYSDTEGASSYGAIPTVTAAGEHTLYYKATAPNHSEASGYFTVRVGRGASSATAPTPVGSLTYTGVAQALVTAGSATGGTLRYSLTQDGEYTTEVPTGTYAGKYSVWYKVAGDDNHTDTEPARVSVTIGRAAATVTADDKSKTFGQDDPALTATVTGLQNGEAASVITYRVSRASGEDVGSYAITPTGADAQGNYSVTFHTGALTISKASYGSKTASGRARANETGSADLSGLIVAGGTAGDVVVTDNDNVLNGTPAVSDGRLSFTFAEGADAGKTATITVPVTSGNYEDYSITVTVEVTNLLVPTVTVEDITATYTGQPVADTAIIGTAKVGDTTVEGAWSFKAGQDLTYVAHSGSKTVVFTPTDGETYDTVETPLTLTIQPAPVTVRATDKSIYVGDAIPALGAVVGTDYTVTGLLEEDTLTGTAVLQYQREGAEVTPTSTAAGSYDIVVTGLSASGNYALTVTKGALTISARPAPTPTYSDDDDDDYTPPSNTTTTTDTTTNADGSVTEVTSRTTTTTNRDGSKTETTRETATTTAADGSTTTSNSTTATTTKTTGGTTTATTNATETATTKGADGSTTESKSESSMVTTTARDGSATTTTTATETATTTAEDGSKTTTESKTNYTETLDASGNGTVESTITETVKDGEGSVTASTVTESTGTVSTGADGTKTTVTTDTITTTNAEGQVSVAETSTTAIDAPDGSTGKTVSDSAGKTISATALVSEKAVETAAQSGGAVTLPVEVKAADATTDAAPIEITMPATNESVTVEIPVTDATPGTVAVIVHADGTEEVVKTSTTGEDSVTLTLEGSATVKIVDNSKEFVDVPDDSWYKETVDWASSREVMIGTGESRFAPAEQTNRAMMAQLLYNFEGASAPAEATASFTDVHDDDWYADSVSWAVELGVAQGEGAAFGAMDNITREAAAVMLFNYAAAKGYDVEPHGDVGTFRDGGDASDWAKTALDWAVGNGIMNGKPGGLIDPQGYATRAEIATIMERFVSRLR